MMTSEHQLQENTSNKMDEPSVASSANDERNSTSEYHAPKPVPSIQDTDFGGLDIEKVRTAISELNAAVKEEENRFFGEDDAQARALKHVQAELDHVQQQFEELKASKEELEQGHEEAKEKWKRLVITMKSEYDNFRESFDNLKESKKQMEEVHRMEKQKMEGELSKLHNQNSNLSSSLDSLRICKEVSDEEHRDAKNSWNRELDICKSEYAALKSELEGRLQEEKKVAEDALATIRADFSGFVKEKEMAEEAHQEEKLKWEEKTAEMETNNESLQCEIEDLKSEMEKLRGFKEEEEKKIAEERAELEQTRETLQTEMDTVCNNFESLSQSMKDTKILHAEEAERKENKIAKLSKQLQTKTDALSLALTKFLNEQQAKEKAEQRMIEIQSDLTKKDEVERKYQADLHEAEKTIITLKSELQSEHDSLQEANARAEALTKSVEELTEALTKSVEELTASKADMEENERKSTEEKEEMENKITSLNAIVAKKLAAINSLEDRCETLQSALNVRDNAKDESSKKFEFLNQLVASKEKEIELLKARCAGLQTTLDESEDKIENTHALEVQVTNAEKRVREATLLMQKKESELQSQKQRCMNLQDCLRKAERGVESIRTEIEKKQRLALDEAEDRAYMLSQMLTKREEEFEAIKGSYESLKATVAERNQMHEQSTSSKKISFLTGLVNSKDSELELMKTRCNNLQCSLDRLHEAHEKLSAKFHENPKMAQMDRNELLVHAEANLEAVNKEIAEKYLEIEHMKAHFDALKGQRSAQSEFELVLGNGDERVHLLQDQVVALQDRCEGLHAALKQAEANAQDDEDTDRVAQMEASLQKMQELYQAECERRKEAEQALLAVGDNDSGSIAGSHSDRRNRLPLFSRNRSAAEQDTTASKKSKWMPLRGRRKKEEISVKTHDARDELECIDSRAPSPRYRQSSPSPREGLQRAGSFNARPSSGSFSGPSPRARALDTMSVGNGPEATLAQIPTHIKNNFLEVGFYKQRLQNTYLPVLVLGPFHVPAGPLREDWLAKFKKNSKVLNLGVYFYGMEGEEAYGTIPWFSFVPYSKAVQRGLTEIPQNIMEKTEAGEELSAVERQIYEGVPQLNAAVNMYPEERPHPLQHLAQQEAGDDLPECIVTAESMEGRISEMGVY